MVTLENGAIVKSVHGNVKHTKSQGHTFVINGTKGGLRALSDTEVEAYIEDPATDYESWFTTYEAPIMVEGAEASGHGGADFYTTYYWIKTILGDEEARDGIIDVYTAVDMCIPGILAYKSIVNGNIPMDIPNLRNPEERDAFRNDTFCTFEDVAGDQWVPNNVKDPTPLPDEVYDRVKALWEEAERKDAEKRAAEAEATAE